MNGRIFSHYRIVEKLGEGGMGEVFLAEDTSLDRYQTAKWARDVLPGEVERLTGNREAGDWMIAYRLVGEAKSALPKDAEVDVLWNQVSVELTVTTDPDGASVSPGTN